MRKLIAAVFLTIYLFNIGGQLVLRQYASYLSDRFFKEQIKKGLYNVNDLTEVKLPANLPDIAEWPGFEKVSGQIQFGDVSYNYVSMRMTRTAIYLKCVPNYETTRLADQNIIVAKNINGAPVHPKDHVPVLKVLLMTQLPPALHLFEFSTPLTSTFLRIVEPVESHFYNHSSVPEQPPRLVC